MSNGFMGVSWWLIGDRVILQDREWSHGAFDGLAELVQGYDELAYAANGIEITRKPWPRFAPDTPIDVMGPNKRGKKLRA